jgi:hypothetical protein
MILHKNIPARPYFYLVAQFAKANGLKFFTIKQQRQAMEAYELHAQYLN